MKVLLYICQKTFFQDAKCTIICNQKSLEKFLKGKTQNNKVNNWSCTLSSYKLEACYIKGTKSVLADCLSRLVDKELTDHNYEPKGQEVGCTIFEDQPPILNNDIIMEINTIDHILDGGNLKELQTKDAYCRHIKNPYTLDQSKHIHT